VEPASVDWRERDDPAIASLLESTLESAFYAVKREF
jgi:hypothetical protein